MEQPQVESRVGGANEQTVDLRTVWAVGFFVQQQAQLPDRIPFDFCIYQLGFFTDFTPGGGVDASSGVDL